MNDGVIETFLCSSRGISSPPPPPPPPLPSVTTVASGMTLSCFL